MPARRPFSCVLVVAGCIDDAAGDARDARLTPARDVAMAPDGAADLLPVTDLTLPDGPRPDGPLPDALLPDAAGECLQVTFQLADGRLSIWHDADPRGSRRDVVSPNVWQLDEANGEREGQPDAFVYFGLNVVPNGQADRGGVGTHEATFAFQRLVTECRYGVRDCDTEAAPCIPPDMAEAPNDADDDCDGETDEGPDE